MTHHEFETMSAEICDLLAEWGCGESEIFHISSSIAVGVATMGKMDKRKFFDILDKMYDHSMLAAELAECGEAH